MIINYWEAADWETDKQIEVIKDESEKIILQKMLRELGNEAVNLSTVEIETVNRCNNTCSFCPVSRNYDIRTPKKMSEELFKKIIGDLQKMQFHGRLNLFSNNEPLIDVRIVSFLKYARGKLPNAFFCLYTNGLLLTEEIYLDLLENLDYLVIDNYNDEVKLNPNIEALKRKEIDEKKCRVQVDVRKKNQILMNRGGLSPNNKNAYLFKSPCILPFVQMVIRPDGEVSRCCQDAYGYETMGDLNTQTVQEVWQGKKFQMYREKMLNEGRNQLEFCKDCDLKGLHNIYPDEWLNLYYEQIYKIIYNKWIQNRKIVFINVQETDVMSRILNMMGIPSDCSMLTEDIEYYVKNHYFLIIGKFDKRTKKILEDNQLVAGQDYLLCLYNMQRKVLRTNRCEYEADIKNKIVKASENRKLIVMGAGENCKKLMKSMDLKPIKIVDNYKAGECWNGHIIDSADEIVVEDDTLILVTPSRYIELVQQLNKMGISSSRIVIGYFII